MHFQDTTPDWPRALLRLPDDSLIKALKASILREAKEKWAAAGRDPVRLITCFRHHDFESAPASDWTAALAHMRRQILEFVDGTWLREFAPFVDIVQGTNEHTATSTWGSPADAARALQSERAQVTVWNREFRGRTITTPDGGHGTIPANCRMTLLSGPVGNEIPREILELSIAEDAPIDYHGYSLWRGKQRAVDDWRNHSGLWHFIEQQHGLKPTWLFGECGPYLGVSEGWRHPDVLGGVVPLLVEAMRQWVRDIARTPAYREGRIYGAGAWFTSGHTGDWDWYELDEPELTAIAEMMRDEWKPGAPAGDDDMDAELKRQLLELAGGVKASAESMIALLEGDDPAPVHDLRDLTNQAVINLFKRALGAATYIERLEQAMGAYPIYQNRGSLYAGPTVEAMPLSDSDRAALIAALG